MILMKRITLYMVDRETPAWRLYGWGKDMESFYPILMFN
jgi:hypothetical protein